MEPVKVTRRLISPEVAKKMLEKNDINRNLSQAWVAYYAQQMRAGEWRDTTDTIKIAPDGTVLDGQHRLSGIISYGKPVSMWIAENVDRDAFTVLDTGKRRSAADVVTIAGHANATNLASVAKMILSTEDGKYSRDKTKQGSARRGLTHTEIVEFITENPELHEITSYAMNVNSRFKFINSVALIGSLYWHFSRKHAKKTDEFFEAVCEGIELTKDSPIRRLRERLMRDAGERTRLNVADRAALFVYAWNAFRQGREVTQLLLPRGVEFPKIM